MSIYDGMTCNHCLLVITGVTADDDSIMWEHHARAHPTCTEHTAFEVAKDIQGLSQLIRDTIESAPGPFKGQPRIAGFRLRDDGRVH